jgi:hypothetical protein
VRRHVGGTRGVVVVGLPERTPSDSSGLTVVYSEELDERVGEVVALVGVEYVEE